MAGGTPLGNMVIELGLDSTKLGDGLTRINNQLKNFERQVKAQNGIASFYKKGTEAAKAYARQKETLTKAFKSQSQALQLLNDKYQQSVQKTGETSKKAKELAKSIELLEAKYVETVRKTGDTSEASQKLGIQLQELKNEYDETVQSIGKMTSASQRLAGQIELGNAKLASYASQLKEVATASYLANSKLQHFGQKLEPVGAGLLRTSSAFDVISDKTRAMSLAIVAGAGLSVKAAVGFESAMTGVKKTVDEQVDSNGRVTYSYGRLENEIRKLAKTIPASTTEIAAVAETAGQLGIKIPDIIDFTKTMIAMGESTNLSATEAATALAKFQNITRLAPKDIGKLGSVIVELGNNMATTEKDITEMGLRLASTGKMVGLTEPQIIALAASLSSVGMEAEAGGSAMSRVLQKINTQVSSSGDLLQGFAKVAGTSAQEFAEKWRTSPSEALNDFVKGLAEVKKKGGDVTQTLKDLKINSVREIDALQRLAGAGNLLAEALGLANDEWINNNALMKETEKRYNTMESKLKVFRNKLNDVAITLGGPLLDALTEGLDAAEPYIKSLADMAKGFSQMDKESQRSVIKMGMFLASISPVSRAISGLTGFLGAGVTGLSNFNEWLAKLGSEKAANKMIAELTETTLGMTSSAVTASGAIGTMGASAATAGTKVGLLAKAGAFLTNPAVMVAGALAIAGGIAYFAQKAGEAYQRTQEWGTKVSKVEAEELQSFKDKVDETNQAITGFTKDSVKGIGDVKSAFQELNKAIGELADKKSSKLVEQALKDGFSQETIEEIKKHYKNIKDNAQQMSDEVIQIYRNAKDQHRQLTAEEKALVLENQHEMINAQLELLDASGKKKVALQKALNGELNELNLTQKTKALQVVSDWIKEENKAYEKRKKRYEEYLDSIKGTDEKSVNARKEVLNKLDELEADHQAKLDAYGQKYAEIYQSINENTLKGITDPELRQVVIDAMKKDMERLGLSYEELMQKSTTASSKIQESHSMWARTLANTTEESRTANALWNSLTWKEGQLKTNAQEELQKVLQAEQGWEQIKFIAKHAELKTDARIAIAEALVAVGQWDSLSPQDKQLIVNGNPAIEAIATSSHHLAIWNSLPQEVKQLLGENAQFLSSAETAKQALDAWNLIPPIQKELLAQNLTSGDVALAQQTINSLTGKTVPITATDETGQPVYVATEAINSVTQYKPAEIKATNNTTGEVEKATMAVNSPKQHKPISMVGSNDTGTSVAKVNASVNSPKQNRPISMVGRDDTGSQVAQVNRAVNSPKQNSPVSMTASDNTWGGVSSARASVNSVQDRTVYITTVHQVVGGKTMGYARGTNHHPGGLAMVNDQKGPMYKELVTLPTGESFIPKGRNVILPLPRGSKVLTASKTKNLMQRMGIPKYADGIGIPEDAKIFRDMSRASRQIGTQTVINADSSRLESLLQEVIRLLSQKTNEKEPIDLTVKIGNMSLKEFAYEITKIQESNRRKSFNPNPF